MKTRSFLTALTRKTAVLLIGAVIAGLAIYGSATKTIPGMSLFRNSPQTPQQTFDGEAGDGLSLNDTDDSFELMLPPPGTDLKSVPYLTPTDATPAADPPLLGTDLKSVPDSEYSDATLVADQALTGQTGAGAEAGDTIQDLSTSADTPAADPPLLGTDLKSVPHPVSGDETEARQENCQYCNKDEQLIVDLNYYRQLLNILKQIDQDRNSIDPDMLDAVHRSIAQTRPGLARILATEETPDQVMPGEPAVEDQLIAALLEGDPQLLMELLRQELAESGAEPDAMDKFLLRLLEHQPNLLVDALGETAPDSNTPEPQPRQPELPVSAGIDGLYLAHVDNRAGASAPARVILVSHEQPFTRTEGGVIRHNGKDYKIVKISAGNDRRQVTLQDMGNNETHVIPWQ